MNPTIIVIPAEGDSAETEQWYVKALREHYRKQGTEVNVLVFEYDGDRCDADMLNHWVKLFAARCEFSRVEIHAQAGLGASIAYRMLALYPERIARVFFIGGAPSDAMTGVAKIFHRYISRLWHLSHIPFFADDPNPWHDSVADQIRASSTAVMRARSLRYRNQLVHIGTWQIQPGWRVPQGCEVYFVPNGKTVRPTWWDNSFNNELAAEIWAQHGVKSTRCPDGYFSLYNLMPAAELFKVMDEVRTFWSNTNYRLLFISVRLERKLWMSFSFRDLLMPR